MSTATITFVIKLMKKNVEKLCACVACVNCFPSPTIYAAHRRLPTWASMEIICGITPIALLSFNWDNLGHSLNINKKNCSVEQWTQKSGDVLTESSQYIWITLHSFMYTRDKKKLKDVNVQYILNHVKSSSLTCVCVNRTRRFLRWANWGNCIGFESETLHAAKPPILPMWPIDPPAEPPINRDTEIGDRKKLH